MKTKFLTLETTVKPKGKKTVFEKLLSEDFKVDRSCMEPLEYDFVMHLGKDPDYGDVFRCWSKGETGFTIAFGIKGDEFN